MPEDIITSIMSLEHINFNIGVEAIMTILNILIFICISGTLITIFRLVLVSQRLLTVALFLVAPVFIVIIASLTSSTDIASRLFLLSCALIPLSIVEMYFRQMEKQLVFNSICIVITFISYWVVFANFLVIGGYFM